MEFQSRQQDNRRIAIYIVQLLLSKSYKDSHPALECPHKQGSLGSLA